MTLRTRRETLRAATGLAVLAVSPHTVRASIEASGPKAVAALPEGWREAVIVVADFDPWIETLTNVGGWELALTGAADSSLN